jgi:phosphomannomutase
LEFGTAGLRGVLGAGPMRMNRLVVRETSAGMGRYLLAEAPDAARRGVVLAYDGRHLSDLFARDAAAVFAGLGLKVHLYDRRAPTPLCAWAVRALDAAGGVMITASHNPPEYNGYKVYWGDGAQIIPPHDRGIAQAILAAAKAPLPLCPLEEAEGKGLLSWLGETVVRRYLEEISRLSVHPERTGREQLRVAYSAMHGVGAVVAEEALRRAGFTRIHPVAAQREPDGSFPTVRFPNPEEPGALDLLLSHAREVGAEIACANDPDADRLAAAVRRESGELVVLTGDQIGALLGDDLLSHAPPNAAVGTTIVSSRLLGAMARKRGVAYFETLTGLKWIADGARKQEAAGRTVVFGYEEAIGFMVGSLVRDKDGISALVAFCELAAALLARGETVWRRLGEIYREHGLYLTNLATMALPADRRGPPLGELLRQRAPQQVAGRGVTAVADLQLGWRRTADGGSERLELPQSDVLVYTLEDDSRVVVRPSGTEPKIKCYYEVIEPMGRGEGLTTAEQRARARLDALTAEHQRELAALSP